MSEYDLPGFSSLMNLYYNYSLQGTDAVEATASISSVECNAVDRDKILGLHEILLASQ